MRLAPQEAVTVDRLESAARKGVDPSAHLAALRALVDGELERLEGEIPTFLDEAARDVRAASRHLLGAGGKRLRPLLVLLCTRAAGGEARVARPLAAAAELVHGATLLHDDVIDDGRVRRGQPAARVLWGNAVSVLSGDFCLARALELTLATGVPGALSSLLGVVRRMIDGEALQLDRRGKLEPDLDAYREVVDAKTASLFAWCGRAGALAAGAGEPVAAALERYGFHLGRAFQIVDDVLDLTGDATALGKDLLADLREGKLTLPVLLALGREPSLAFTLRAAADEDDPARAARRAATVAEVVTASGALEEARAQARAEGQAACQALATLPSGLHREALAGIARDLTERTF